MAAESGLFPTYPTQKPPSSNEAYQRKAPHFLHSTGKDTTDPVQPSNQRGNKYRIASYSYFRRVQM